jgi:peroxiredoxin
LNFLCIREKVLKGRRCSQLEAWMKTSVLTIMVFFLLMAGPASAVSVKVGDESPPFLLKTIDNRAFRSEEMKGKKPLFLVFWATWCSACKEEIPKLNEIFSSFEPKGMEFLAINVGVNDSLARVKRYIKKYKITYPVAFEGGNRVTKLFGVQGTPTIIIVDRQGIVRYRSPSVPDDLDEHFQELIK